MALAMALPVLLLAVSCAAGSSVLGLRGGIGPRPADNTAEYYSQFDLDYGSADTKRSAGALRGCNFLPSTLLADYSAAASDPFVKWVYEHLEKGAEPITDRVKPFYAVDFGTKSSLPKGQNPKVFIVTRRLKADNKGYLDAAPAEIDVEVREIWQPWLKMKCTFATRYIVPNRSNILRIMEAKGKFLNVAKVIDDSVSNRTRKVVEMTFKPSLLDRILGKKDVVVRHEIDSAPKKGNPLLGIKSSVGKMLNKNNGSRA